MADDTEERAAATASSNGLGGEETTPPPDPNAAATAATGPEAAATAATNANHAPEADAHLGLHAYAARYSGRTLVARLLFIARVCGEEAMEMEALRMALHEVRKGKDTLSYGDVCLMVHGRFGHQYDHAWVDTINQGFLQGKQLIEKDISYSKENQITARIMTGYANLGDLYYDHGQLPEAFKSYIQMEEFVTASEDAVKMCMKSILINIQLNKYDRVLQYVNMAKTCLGLLGPIDIAKLQAVAGLAWLGRKQYKLAALQFLETGPELGSNYSDLIAPEDVALYGAVCALASFDSAEMKTNVIDNVKFGHFLQLVPEIQQLVHDFYNCHHVACMDDLEKLKPSLLLDLHLADHVETLFLVISQKSGYVVFEDFNLDFLQNENEEEPPFEATEPQPTAVIVSNLVLPDQFNDETPLIVSTHYKFVNAKELLLSLGKRSIAWVSRHNAHAVLINASLFVRDSVRDDEERFDGRMVVVSDAKFSIFEVQYSSYTITCKPLKETQLKDKEDSALDRFQIKGNIWTRRRICLKNNHSYHLIQWRKTSGLRQARVQPLEAAAAAHSNVQVQPPEAAAQNENYTQLNDTMNRLIHHLQDTTSAQVQPPEAAAQNENYTQLNDTMNRLIDHLQDTTSALAQATKTMTETRKSVVELNCSLAEARKTATMRPGAGGVVN